MEFDSKEELYFSWYLEVLRNWNFVESWEKVEEPYKLTDDLVINYLKPMKRVKDKILTQTLFSGREYTPDFKIKWTDQAIGIFTKDLVNGIVYKNKFDTPFISQYKTSIVEVKGVFDNNNMTRLATNNIKDVYEKHGVYITIAKIPMLFKKTFTPERYLLTDKSFKPRKIKYATRTIKEFITKVSE
jgi:hypothetical protein